MQSVHLTNGVPLLFHLKAHIGYGAATFLLGALNLDAELIALASPIIQHLLVRFLLLLPLKNLGLGTFRFSTRLFRIGQQLVNWNEEYKTL